MNEILIGIGISVFVLAFVLAVSVGLYWLLIRDDD